MSSDGDGIVGEINKSRLARWQESKPLLVLGRILSLGESSKANLESYKPPAMSLARPYA